MTPPLLALSNVTAHYGSIEALHGICLDVFPGEAVALIGANGAGKTTTLLTISGLVRASRGHVLFEGERIDTCPSHHIVARGVVQVPEGRKIFSRMTVRENLDLGAYLRRDTSGVARDRARVFELFPVLFERQSQLAGTLSGGEQQMLAIGRALMARPRLLLLDEPSMGVAPILVDKIFAALKALNHEGMSLLLVEQSVFLALDIATRAYVLETGKVRLDGSSQELLADERVREAYLGH